MNLSDFFTAKKGRKRLKQYLWKGLFRLGSVGLARSASGLVLGMSWLRSDSGRDLWRLADSLDRRKIGVMSIPLSVTKSLHRFSATPRERF